MSYMNSYIAEIANELEVPYFDRETGKSIIDEVLVEMVDKNNKLTLTKVDKLMDSYLTRVKASEEPTEGA